MSITVDSWARSGGRHCNTLSIASPYVRGATKGGKTRTEEEEEEEEGLLTNKEEEEEEEEEEEVLLTVYNK